MSTVQFGLDGVEYEVDLSAANAENFRKAVAEFVAVARRTGGRLRRGAPASGKSGDPGQASRIREWALENGVELAARGRIPAHVVEAYNEAQSAPAKRPAKRGNSRKKA